MIVLSEHSDKIIACTCLSELTTLSPGELPRSLRELDKLLIVFDE